MTTQHLRRSVPQSEFPVACFKIKAGSARKAPGCGLVGIRMSINELRGRLTTAKHKGTLVRVRGYSTEPQVHTFAINRKTGCALILKYNVRSFSGYRM